MTNWSWSFPWNGTSPRQRVTPQHREPVPASPTYVKRTVWSASGHERKPSRQQRKIVPGLRDTVSSGDGKPTSRSSPSDTPLSLCLESAPAAWRIGRTAGETAEARGDASGAATARAWPLRAEPFFVCCAASLSARRGRNTTARLPRTSRPVASFRCRSCTWERWSGQGGVCATLWESGSWWGRVRTAALDRGASVRGELVVARNSRVSGGSCFAWAGYGQTP